MGVVVRLMLAGFALLLGFAFRPDDPPEDPPEEDSPPDDPPPADEPFKVYKTKKDHEAAFGPIRIEGRDAERNQWHQELGVSSRAEAKRLIDAQRDIEREAETQVEKAEREKQEAEQREQERAAEAEATEERRKAFVKRTVLERRLEKDGIREDRVQRALKDAELDNLEISDQDEVTGAEEESKRLRDETPEWFGEVQEERVAGSGGGRRGGGGGGSGEHKAASRWADRKYGGKKAG